MASAMTIIRQAAGNEYLARALQNVGDYQALVEMRDDVQAKLDSLVGAPLPPNPVRPDQLDDWLAASVTAAEQQRIADQQHRILTGLLTECTHGVDSIVGVGADAMLASLAADLNEVMAEVDTVATKLKSASTPAEAIERGVEKAWRQLPELRERYDQIRAAQMCVVPVADPLAVGNATSPYLADPLASDLLLSNLDELVPGWRQRDQTISMGTPPSRTPWPADPVAQLLWLSTSPAEPWVPTTSQLSVLWHDRGNRPPVEPDKPANIPTTTVNPRWSGDKPTVRPLRTARAITSVDAPVHL
jgi:hypothetical protein